MRALIIGAHGQVGHELRRAMSMLAELHLGWRHRPDHAQANDHRLDLLEPGAARALIQALRPALVFNAAAYTKVDLAETEREQAERLNHHAAAEIALACAEVGARLIHYSTDYVYAGLSRQPLREDEEIAPRSVYGASKARGDQAVLAAAGHALVLRVCAVYAARGQNFLRTMLRHAGAGRALRVVADQHIVPTPARLIAQVSVLCAQQTELTGLWHLAASGQTTWHGFASAIVERALARRLIPDAVTVTPISTAEWPAAAQRPSWAALDASALSARLKLRLPDWQTALDAVFDELSMAAADV